MLNRQEPGYLVQGDCKRIFSLLGPPKVSAPLRPGRDQNKEGRAEYCSAGSERKQLYAVAAENLSTAVLFTPY